MANKAVPAISARAPAKQAIFLIMVGLRKNPV